MQEALIVQAMCELMGTSLAVTMDNAGRLGEAILAYRSMKHHDETRRACFDAYLGALECDLQRTHVVVMNGLEVAKQLIAMGAVGEGTRVAVASLEMSESEIRRMDHTREAL